MPGAGKSTIGVVLAKLTGLSFRDTDLDIQVREGATLQDILEKRGHLALRTIEAEVLQSIPLENTIVSTGGSAVYSASAMTRLHAAGPMVYLDVDLATLEQRVASEPNRGIASAPGHSFADIHAERTPLYEQHATVTVKAEGRSPEAIARDIIQQLA